MITKKLLIICVLLAVGCQNAGIKAQNGAIEVVKESNIDPQLKVNKDVLLSEGSSEQMRVNAASLMIQNPSPAARQILLDILKASEKNAAKNAICRGLASTGSEISNKSDFIQPLLGVFAAEDAALARDASDALLIFPYEEISKSLEKDVSDPSAASGTRLNMIQALKRPDIGAISKLMELLDDPDKNISQTAEKTLVSLSIPVDKDVEVRKQIINGIRRLGKEEFIRTWEIRQLQEQKMNQLQAELDSLQKLYEQAVTQLYEQSGDADKGKFLVKQLGSTMEFIRLWALKTVYADILKSGKTLKMPPDVGVVLLDLIGDKNKNIRLKTAQVLSFMRELDSAQRLLDQIKIEQDPQVRAELFVALGWACYYSSGQNSAVRLVPEIKLATLQLAEKYLGSENPKEAQNGGEVIRKLLEHNGLKEEDVDHYFQSLIKRFQAENGKPDGSLRGELLSDMALLCGLSVHRTKAIMVFKPVFMSSLRDPYNFARESAVDGLVYIDKAEALKILRDGGFVNDESPRVRMKIVELADEVGGRDDMEWLLSKLGSSAESDKSWQAMLKIFNDSDAAFLEKWLERVNNGQMEGKLSDDKKISFLEIALKKFVSENQAGLIQKMNLQLADLYFKTARYQQAAQLFVEMRKKAKSDNEQNTISVKLLETYFAWGNFESAVNMISNSLSIKDLDGESYEVRTIDKYLNGSSNGSSEMIVEQLSKMQFDQPRPQWEKQLKVWSQKFRRIPDPNTATPAAKF